MRKIIHLVVWGVIPVLSLVLMSNKALEEYETRLGKKETGISSYYADKFHGKKTASGEIFNMYELTAAHRFMKFGSLIRVTNLNNGKQVEVKVNDRGPYAKDRILDLSFAAAKQIGLIQSGTAPVSIEIVRVGYDGKHISEVNSEELKKNPNAGKSKYLTRSYSIWGTLRKPTGYGVQIFSYSSLEEAVNKGKELYKGGFEKVFIQAGWDNKKNRTFRIMVGEGEKTEVAKLISQLKKKGYESGFVKTHLNE